MSAFNRDEVGGQVTGEPERWFHIDGTECVAGWHTEGPEQGCCSEGGGPVTPCPGIAAKWGAAHKGGWCSRDECPCHRPGPVCNEYMGIEETYPWCPRCGWNEAAHGYPMVEGERFDCDHPDCPPPAARGSE